jgi:hypothetical protein
MYSDYGESMAKIAAHKWLVRELENMDLPQPLDESEVLPSEVNEEILEETVPVEEEPKQKVIRVTFEMDSEGVFIKQDADGNDYVDMVLQDVFEQEDGLKYPAELLQQWADDINSGKIDLIGDNTSHELYDSILDKYVDPDVIVAKLAEAKKSKGIAKGIKAVFEKGRLWVRTIIDKRYKRHVKNKGVSLEALVDVSEDGTVLGGDLLGFTYMLNGKPQAARGAVVV